MIVASRLELAPNFKGLVSRFCVRLAPLASASLTPISINRVAFLERVSEQNHSTTKRRRRERKNTATMIRQEFSRIDPKRRTKINHRNKQFEAPAYHELEYKHRLNFYVVPPTADITLEQFEQWAIDRLRGESARRMGGN